MNTIKKIIFVFIIGIFLASVLRFGVWPMVLKHIDPETKLNRAVMELSGKIHGNVTFGGYKLKIFPRPGIVLTHVRITVPGKAELNIEQMRLYPKIRALFQGNLLFSGLRCESLNSTINVEDADFWEKGLKKELPAADVMAGLRNYSALLARSLPDISIFIRDGKIDFIKKGKQVSWLSDFNARIRLPPKTAMLEIDCRSNLWDQAGLALHMDGKTLKTAGRIDFTGLKIDHIPENLISFGSHSLSRLSADLHLTFKASGSGEFYGKIQGGFPGVVIQKAGQDPVSLNCSRLKGDVTILKNRVRVNLDQAVFNAPRAVLDGRFDWDKSKPRATLEINGSVMDVAAARSAALGLAGRFQTTQKIFEIIRDGVVPRISFSASADSPYQFIKTENIQLQGSLLHGKIVTPNSDLHLQDVFGEVVLSDGILKGKNIRSRLENSYGREGNFSIGMIDPKAPYHLETRIEADLVQLPPVLKRLIHSEGFRREMNRISDVKGHAVGKLILGDRRDRIRPRVEVDGFNLSMNYSRVPMTFRLAGEKFLYDSRRIDVHDVNGTIGKNTVSGLDAIFNWQRSPALSCRVNTATLKADELYPWLKSFQGFSRFFSRVNSTTGSVALTGTQIDGPLFEPAKWLFNTSGKFAGLSVEASAASVSIKNASGRFLATQNRLEISNAAVEGQDITLTGSLVLTDYLSRLTDMQTGFNGKIGSKTAQWVLDQIKLPVKVHEEDVWNFSGGEINYRPGEKTDFKGLITVQNGPSITLDAGYSPGALSVNMLRVKDADSDASFSFHQQGQTYDVNYKGHFSPSTMEKVFTGGPSYFGALTGDFQLQMKRDHPGNIKFTGQMEVSDFSFPAAMNLPIKIAKASLTQKNGVHKAVASLLWENKDPFRIDGDITSIENRINFDFDLFTDTVDLDAFINRIRQIRQQKQDKNGKRFWDLNISGHIDTHAEQVNYGGYAWSQVNAGADLSPDEIRIRFGEARLCGLETPGLVIIKPKSLEFAFQPKAEALDIQTAFSCFGGKKGLIHGKLDLSGDISAQGAYEQIAQSTKGKFSLSARDGRIYRFGLMSKIFALLNITEIFRGTLPDLAQEGFKYDSIEASGTISGTKILVSHAVIVGPSMDMAFQGEIDRKKKTMEFHLLVTPLKTIDFIVKKIPLVNKILSGNLVGIPIKIQGNISDPEVSALQPSAIGSGLLEIMKNTLKLPVTIIQPLFDEKKKED